MYIFHVHSISQVYKEYIEYLYATMYILRFESLNDFQFYFEKKMRIE